MTKEQFIKNNKGISGGSDLPQEYLSSIYDNICKAEIKMKSQGDENFTLLQPEKKGFVRKQGGRIKNWKVRYFVLQNNCLYYFKKENVITFSFLFGSKLFVSIGYSPMRNHSPRKSAREGKSKNKRIRSVFFHWTGNQVM